ncbi:MAG: PocR ligand-binding domain-containing protein [Spirochaetes bacterium]|nr:PocR ligand-binding domain-containing protein [Spirochaetota bacterium]
MSVKYIIETSALNDILRTLYRLFDIRITFFDLTGEELAAFDIKPLSQFCRGHRLRKDFNTRCERCDAEHLAAAKRSKAPHIYICHAGLYEAIVPLYNGDTYLGALVFGQVRPVDAAERKTGRRDAAFGKLPKKSRAYMEDMASLLKNMSEYILSKEILRHRMLPWLKQIDDHIRNHLNTPISINDLADVSKKSPSFITHYFKRENGLTPMRYILRIRMQRAKAMLSNGSTVRDTAEALGFYDEYHFSKAFKKETGMPPSRYFVDQRS